MSDLRLELQSFTKNVCDGFVRFQQNGDFVDMTLAAEGHLVKVHKNIMSVSSPYIEALLKSIPCKHPVIFLYNVTHEILGYILEYVYMGVVIVPKDKIDQFALACKQLQIVGLMDYEDAMLDASVKLNKPTRGKKHQIHSTVNKPRSTRTHFNLENKSNRDEETNQTNNSIILEPTIEEESCRNTVPMYNDSEPQVNGTNVNRNVANVDRNVANVDRNVTNVDRKVANVDRNVTNVDINIENVDRNVTNVDRNVTNVDRNVTHIDRNVINVESENQNTNLLIETKNKRKLSSIIPGPAAKQIKFYVDLSHTQSHTHDPVNNNCINNLQFDNTDQPNYQIDLSNISTVEDKSICNDSKTSATGIYTPHISQPMGGKSIDYNGVILSDVDNQNPSVDMSHSNIDVVNNSICVRPMATLMLNPVDGTLNVTQNNETDTDMENKELDTNVEELEVHTDASNDYNITNWLQLKNNGNSATKNNLNYNGNTRTEISEISINIASKNISNGTANTLVFDKNTGFIVPVSQQSDTLHTGDSNAITISAENYQNQFQHHVEFQNISGCSHSEYRSKILEDAKPLYTLSNRGSLQMILNRFTYGVHHASGTNRRRWRCIQYRDLRCPATVDTADGDIIKRSFEHTHPFHDSKIIRKGQKDAVFAKMSHALKYANALQKEPPSIRNQEEYKRDLAMLIAKEDELNCMSSDLT